MYRKTQHIHFVGIGGIGMSGIAEVLINLGYKVSGSDLRETDITRRLDDLGGKIHRGHNGEWIQGADVVVISSAVKGLSFVSEVVESESPEFPAAATMTTLLSYANSIASVIYAGGTSVPDPNDMFIISASSAVPTTPSGPSTDL